MEKLMSKEEYEKFCKDAEDLKFFDGRGTFDLYVCDKCSCELVTTNAVKGVTPFTIRCRRCGGTMFHTKTSRNVPSSVKVVRWIRPTYEEYSKMSTCQRQWFNLRCRFIMAKNPC